jgi:MFS family permease
MKNQKLFSKDFTLVVIGQIISLFGNATIRFALPLYLLNLTGSSALYGTVTACAFVPAILLSPIGGIVADRVNKRNIMVALDFFTAAVILGFTLLMGGGNLVLLLTVTLMLLYGIAGAYQPSVQASIPALVGQERFMEANSVINAVSSLASLVGPVLGGMLYSAYGLEPVLWVCMVCFVLSAVMEIFIRTGLGGRYPTDSEGGFRQECALYPEGEACDREGPAGGLRHQSVPVRDDRGGAALPGDGGA